MMKYKAIEQTVQAVQITPDIEMIPLTGSQRK